MAFATWNSRGLFCHRYQYKCEGRSSDEQNCLGPLQNAKLERTEPKWTLVVLARLVYHYHYLNSIINEFWQDYNNRLFIGVPAVNPICITLHDKVCQAWYSARAMEKTDFRADPQDKHSQADTAAGFSTDAERQVRSHAFPYQTYKVPWLKESLIQRVSIRKAGVSSTTCLPNLQG